VATIIDFFFDGSFGGAEAFPDQPSLPTHAKEMGYIESMIKDGEVSGSASATASASPRSVASSVSDILKFQGHPLHAIGMGTVPRSR
jgi:hypothetical protein